MNLKTKVIAAHVANLTDARYFAAWGVDYMSYDLEEGSDTFIGQEAIKEIIDWVEGPKYLGHITGLSLPANVASHVTGLGLSGLITGPYTEVGDNLDVAKNYREISDISSLEGMSEQLLIVKCDDESALANKELFKATSANNEVYIDGIASLDVLESLLTEVNPTGIVLRGGEEEKVGYKSYDELDVIFEWLEVV